MFLLIFFLMLESELIQFGLTPKETQVYLTLLKLGEAPASTIATRSHLNRLTVYSILKRFLEINLVTCYFKRNVRIYRVTSPDALLRHCDEQISTIQAKRAHLKSLLPQLEASFASAQGKGCEYGYFRFIQDRALFETICISALQASSDWYVIHREKLWPYIQSIRPQTKLVPRCLVPYSQAEICEEYGVVAHFLPDSYVREAINFMVMGSKVVFILNHEDFTAIEIEHLVVAQRLKAILNLLWEIEFFQD